MRLKPGLELCFGAKKRGSLLVLRYTCRPPDVLLYAPNTRNVRDFFPGQLQYRSVYYRTSTVPGPTPIGAVPYRTIKLGKTLVTVGVLCLYCHNAALLQTICALYYKIWKSCNDLETIYLGAADDMPDENKSLVVFIMRSRPGHLLFGKIRCNIYWDM